MDNNLNAMLVGNHGVGKTAIVIDLCKKKNLKLKYFSCSTLDPFTDLVGVPFAREDKETGREYLKMVRPIEIDEAEIIFFDEFNRADAKVHNALMEIIQFGSLNGEHLPNLRMCWAAMNPPGKDYDVEELDPALIDRFDVFEDVAPRPSVEYLVSKGIKKPVAQALIGWYNDQDNNKRDQTKVVTPRRLEKIGKVWEATGEVKYAIPHWFPQDKTKLRTMLHKAEAQAAEQGLTNPGSAQEGPTKQFQYNDVFIKENADAVAKYLSEHTDDLETHNAVKEVLANRQAQTLASDYGLVSEALIPSLREGLVTGLSSPKLSRLSKDIDPSRTPNLDREVQAEKARRGL